MFTPNIDGVGRIFELRGENGPFYIAQSGSRPDFSNGLYYADGKNEFCFYALVKFNSATKIIDEIDIYKAVAFQRFHGPQPIIDNIDEPIVESNIRLALKSRRYYDLAHAYEPGFEPREIVFSWGI